MSTLKDKISTALATKRKQFVQNNAFIKRTKESNEIKLGKEFFNKSCIDLANLLLGKLLVRKLDNNTILKGRIVETECYPGGEDKASHSFNGRRTVRNEPMYMEPGTAYIYIIYGIHHCFNISSEEAGGAVLIRALEPIEGIEKMQEYRTARRANIGKIQDLCKGPSNLCTSMNISKSHCNKVDLSCSSILWLENDDCVINKDDIVSTSRIGISSAREEWAQKPYRFYIVSNTSVSKRDRIKEKELRKITSVS